MIQSLSGKHKRKIAWPLFVVFYLQTLIAPMYASGHIGMLGSPLMHSPGDKSQKQKGDPSKEYFKFCAPVTNEPLRNPKSNLIISELKSPDTTGIGGPSSPEAGSFKAVGSDNLVNLFTGDFSYSIPLLDVGGYPVNLFYSAGINMEQEASWVGLGWNLNPGSVSRNMRGVPDDFNGTDQLTQSQNVKPNRTWGGEIGVDVEVLGIKKPKIGLNFSLGVSYNNYLGPAIDIGAGVSLTIPITETIKGEKDAPKDTITGLSLTVGLNTKLSSRSGLTFSPSLNAGLHLDDKKADVGVGISTSYNSRTGIRELNISSQASQYRADSKHKGDDYNKATNSMRFGSLSSVISFARPTYMPTLRMPMEYANYSGQLELGGGFFGIRGAGTATGYYSESKVPAELRIVKKPLVGFLYSEKAYNNLDAVMDFNRVNDGEVTPNTPIISAPQYAYDVFSVQGEGTGGSIRAYRSELGYMRDNVTTSKDKNISIGFDIAPAGHFGGNWNIIHTPTRVGGWEDANNGLSQVMKFQSPRYNSSFENIYFKNPGEATVTTSERISRLGGDNLVRFKLDGSNVNPMLTASLEQFNKKTGSSKGNLVLTNIADTVRDKRTQVITMLNAYDARKVGLDTAIRNYTGVLDGSNNLAYTNISRIADYRKAHHISEIDVLEQSGMRYVYGLPVYNKTQTDFTFSAQGAGNESTGIVGFEMDEPTIDSRHMANQAKIDGYVMSQETPAYASAFLITGLLSPDYVDVTGNGITEDDLGGAVKFNYKRSDSIHRWRTPRNNSLARTSHFNEGLKSEKKDNKATISYGEREVWYMNSIESKSMVAIFTTGSRSDAHGVASAMDGRINSSESANKRLDKIDLYTKSELKAKGLANARPIKTVHFVYDYSLCSGTPDNASGGKLSLASVYFTYNGQPRASKDKYVFNYGNTGAAADNPSYANNASDKWGTYKDPSASPAVNPANLTNSDYPYTSGTKVQADQFAGAWSLKKILLPSGGQMEITYEADDYAYVQNRRACDMFSIYGLGNTSSYTTDNSMYFPSASGVLDNMYVYVQLPQALESTDPAKQKTEILSRYLEGINQLAFKVFINMPKGVEPLTVYAKYSDYGLCANSAGRNIIFLKLTAVNGQSPLSKSAIGFITENLPGQAFPGYEVEVDGVAAFLEMAGSMLGSIKNAFKNVNQQMRSAGKARTIVLAKSFVRLNNPFKMKRGGGVRVKRVLVRDNWDKMKGTYVSTYGQDYDYTSIEKINNKDTVVSSGVASYEPGIGSEENPFREIVDFSNKMPLASAQYGAIEMPMLESFYPSACVGYSKVTVRSIHRTGTHGDSSLRSAIGKQVTEFYTAREFPTFSAYTGMNSMDYHRSSLLNLFYKDITDRRTVSQGFLVETNDMHGKMRSQAAYSERDEKTPLSYSYHFYKNTGKNGLLDKVDYVYNEDSGSVQQGLMGVDMELMTDVREFRVQSDGFNGQIQTDFFSFVPFPIFVIPFLPLKTYTENKYRAVTCTKLINYHAIEDSVIVMDKGSVVSTKTILYDSETGAPVLSQTANEYNDPIYNLSYPAHWAYTGMSSAYKNIDRLFTNVNFYDGKIRNSNIDVNKIFESGDELYIINAGLDTSTCIPSSGTVLKLWALDRGKYTITGQAQQVIVPPVLDGKIVFPPTHGTTPPYVKNIVFIDARGNLFTKKSVAFRIIRSGKRNLLNNSIASFSMMANPVHTARLEVPLGTTSTFRVVAASAIEFKDIWQSDNNIFPRYKQQSADSEHCPAPEILDCTGHLENSINPYLKGLIGNFRPFKNMVYYGPRAETNASSATNTRANGYLDNFYSFWKYQSAAIMAPDYSNTKWVWNSQGMKYNTRGMELETKDALNIYTAAQYGFDKTIAVALANNSRYGRMFGEGFEDYRYNATLNADNYGSSCVQRYIDFSGLPHSNILNTDSLNKREMNAHSGKYVLGVNAHDTAIKNIAVDSLILDSFHLAMPSDTIKGLQSGGMLYKKIYSQPALYNPTEADTASYKGPAMTVAFDSYDSDHPVDTASGTSLFHNGVFQTDQYFEAITCKTYGFHLGVGDLDCNFLIADSIEMRAAIHMEIKDLDGNLLAQHTVLATHANTYENFSVYLPAGIYHMQTFPYYYYIMQNPPITTGERRYHSSFLAECTNDTLHSFRSPFPSVRCAVTDSIHATDSMLNPVYAVAPGEKMLFSAWVREHCDSLCAKLNYNNSMVRLVFKDAAGSVLGSSTATINPSGNIIDHWQKVEGEFTAPISAATMSINFINNTDSVSYWDDIRIHPFNANMKTYAYDFRNLRLAAELDENNYAAFYEYDEEGQLVRVKKETINGIKTITETRSSKQKIITTVQ